MSDARTSTYFDTISSGIYAAGSVRVGGGEYERSLRETARLAEREFRFRGTNFPTYARHLSDDGQQEERMSTG